MFVSKSTSNNFSDVKIERVQLNSLFFLKIELVTSSEANLNSSIDRQWSFDCLAPRICIFIKGRPVARSGFGGCAFSEKVDF